MTIAGPPAGEAAGAHGTGHVVCDLDDTEVFLRGAGHRVYRLRWFGKARDRRRALPAGRYRITGYRIARRDGEGRSWFISTTSHGYRDLVVRGGGQTVLKISPVIHFEVRGKKFSDQVNVNALVRGEHHVGLSIYREGKRIPLSYRLVDAAGKELHSGSLRYG